MPPVGAPTVTAAVTAPAGGTVLRPHYPCLEGLRTIGVMALFFQHTGYTTGLQAREGFSWMGHLELGPTMFFVLSAFLLYQPFVTANLVERSPQTWRRFVKTRFLRVVPAYWVTLVLLILFFRADPDNPVSGGLKIDGWKDGLAIFGFAQTYNPDWFFRGIASAYTLNAEVVFYLLLPAYALVLRRWTAGLATGDKVRRELYALGAVVAASAVWRIFIEVRYREQREACNALLTGKHISCAALNWFPAYADYFALGMAVAVVASWRTVRRDEPRWLQRVGAAGDAWWIGALVLFVLYSSMFGTFGLEYVPPGKAEVRHLLNAAIVLCLLVPGVFGAQDRGAVRWFLRWRPIAYTGMVSYGVYLWHQGWTDKAMSWTGSQPLNASFVVVTGIAVATSIIGATVLWYGLERPVNRRRDLPLRRWLQPLRRV